MLAQDKADNHLRPQPQPRTSTHSGGSTARTSAAPRLLLHAGANAVIEVVEEYVSAVSDAGQYFTCGVAELFLEDNAEV